LQRVSPLAISVDRVSDGYLMVGPQAMDFYWGATIVTAKATINRVQRILLRRLNDHWLSSRLFEVSEQWIPRSTMRIDGAAPPHRLTEVLINSAFVATLDDYRPM